MNGIEIAREDDFLPLCVQPVAYFEQMGIKIEFERHSLLSTPAARKIDVVQQEVLVPCADHTALIIETRVA